MKNNQYSKKLTTAFAVKIINGATANAKSLYDDAKILFEHEKYARAVSLAILSIEESGKISIIRSILMEEDQKEISKLWKSYRRHYDKNTLWIVPELIAKGARKIDDMKKIADSNSDHMQTLDDLKQLCFYSDVFGNGKLSIPDNVADKKIAGIALSIANSSFSNELTTEESLDIWKKHLKPVFKKSMQEMKLAIIACYNELEEKKIIEKGTAQKMHDFLF